MSERKDSEKKNVIITILGRKGMGKSFLTKQIVEGEPRVIALDTLGEYGEGRGAEIIWGKEAAIRAMAACAGKRRYRLALRGLDEDEMLDALEMAWELPDSLVIVEEASMICRPSYLPRQMATLLRYGRHRAISQIYLARRPSELPRDVTAQSDIIVTLQQTEVTDLKYLRAAGFREDELMALAAMPEEKAVGYVLARGSRSKMPIALIQRLRAQKPLPGTNAKIELTPEIENEIPPADETPEVREASGPSQ